jgi:hypothetical protein
MVRSENSKQRKNGHQHRSEKRLQLHELFGSLVRSSSSFPFLLFLVFLSWLLCWFCSLGTATQQPNEKKTPNAAKKNFSTLPSNQWPPNEKVFYGWLSLFSFSCKKMTFLRSLSFARFCS